MSEIIPFKKPAKIQDLVLRFLNSPGHKRDADFYLQQFSSQQPGGFALIVLNQEVLQEDIDAVLFEIRYLMRLSLFPVVMIHASSDFLEKLEIDAYFKKTKITSGILSHDLTDDEKIEFIKERIKKRTLPLLQLDPKHDLVQQVTKFVNLLRTGKVVFVNRAEGLINQEDLSLIRIINFRDGIDVAIKDKNISKKDAPVLKLCFDIIKKSDHRIVISLVSPNNLLRELFTVKGSGTLLQMGSKICTQQDINKLDPRSLKRLLEMSQEKPFNNNWLSEKYDWCYFEENYMGAALLKKHKDMAYLSTFAVGIEARGLGIGKDLWNEIIKNHQKIFWRSRSDKFITHWYVKQCDGMQKKDEWTVFWKGLESSAIASAIDFALAQKNICE